MFLLRLLSIYLLLVFNLFAKDEASKLDLYYQSLLSLGSFYYESGLTIEYYNVKSLLSDDNSYSSTKNDFQKESKSFFLNKAIEIEDKDIETISSNLYFSVYEELDEHSSIFIVKSLVDEDKTEEIYYLENRNSCRFSNLHSDNLITFNYINYLEVYYNCYKFNLVKVTSDYYFFKGKIKDSSSDLFNEITIKLSKEYNIPTRVLLKDYKNKNSVSIETEEVDKIGQSYISTKLVVYTNKRKINIYLKNISLGVAITTENDYKITLDDYISLTNDAKQ